MLFGVISRDVRIIFVIFVLIFVTEVILCERGKELTITSTKTIFVSYIIIFIIKREIDVAMLG